MPLPRNSRGANARLRSSVHRSTNAAHSPISCIPFFTTTPKNFWPKLRAHTVLARYAARDVLRHLALLLLDGAPLTSERFKEIVTALKDRVGIGSREIFHPIRLALTGRAGEGELDRVILLLDEAAAASFAVPVKSARERILEFCAALD